MRLRLTDTVRGAQKLKYRSLFIYLVYRIYLGYNLGVFACICIYFDNLLVSVLVYLLGGKFLEAGSQFLHWGVAFSELYFRRRHLSKLCTSRYVGPGNSQTPTVDPERHK